MKYYSDVTKKLYDNEDALRAAEETALSKERKEKEARERRANERKLAAEGVEAARKKMVAAQKEYRDQLQKFCASYGTYHYSTTGEDDEVPSLFDLFRFL